MASATLTPARASEFARLTLDHVEREYPNHIMHKMEGPADARTPRELHPLFYGSFDWHSCVLGYWLLARVYRTVPGLPERGEIAALFDRQIAEANIAGELAYLEPKRLSFERPYGWSWLLHLAAEFARHDSEEGKRWAATLAPLAARFAKSFSEFLPKAVYPVRVGTHFNTAFAIALSLDYAEAVGDGALASLLREKARGWYGADADCQCWEPNGDDFLSSALVEAECMRRVLPPAEFAPWLDRFLPRLAACEPETLFEPVVVTDRSDGKIAHLEGLNITRGWCWRSLARTFAAADPRRLLALDAAERHLAVSLPHLADDYMVSHWAAAYAVMALEA